MSREWTDADILAALDMVANGKSADQAAKDMSKQWGTAVTKNMVIGLTNRIRKQTQPCTCAKPANQDGGMNPGWWYAGLAKQAAT